MSNVQVQEEGFWGGITLVGVIWAVLAFCVFAVCFSIIYFLAVFTVYAIWYFLEKFSDRPKVLRRVYNLDTGESHEIMVQDNPADIIKVFHFFAYLVYSVVGLFLLALFIKALTM
jgi:hypothetical protein